FPTNPCSPTSAPFVGARPRRAGTSMISYAIHILESPTKDELAASRSEGAALKTALAQCGVQASVTLVTQVDELLRGLELTVSRHARLAETIPILHLAMHGSKNGAMLTSGDLLAWERLSVEAGLVNAALGGRLHLVLSTCAGFRAIDEAWASSTLPF